MSLREQLIAAIHTECRILPMTTDETGCLRPCHARYPHGAGRVADAVLAVLTANGVIDDQT